MIKLIRRISGVRHGGRIDRSTAGFVSMASGQQMQTYHGAAPASARVQLQLWLFVGFCAAILYVALQIIKPFTPIFLWSLALGVAGDPLNRAISRRTGRRNVAALVSVVVMATAVVLPILFASRELANAARENSDAITKLADPSTWQATMAAEPRLQRAFEWADRNFGLANALSVSSQALAQNAQAFIAGSLWSVIQLVLIFFTLFYFFRDRELFLARLKSSVPLSENESTRVFGEISDAVHATIYGTILVAFIQGSLGALMFWYLRIPGSWVWGVVMAILAVIPYLGAFVVWAPVALYLAFLGKSVEALVLSFWGIFVIGLIDNLLYPLLVGKRLRYHTLLVFFFILGGVAYFGASGLILGPVVLALLDALIKIWRARVATLDTQMVHKTGQEPA